MSKQVIRKVRQSLACVQVRYVIYNCLSAAYSLASKQASIRELPVCHVTSPLAKHTDRKRRPSPDSANMHTWLRACIYMSQAAAWPAGQHQLQSCMRGFLIIHYIYIQMPAAAVPNCCCAYHEASRATTHPQKRRRNLQRGAFVQVHGVLQRGAPFRVHRMHIGATVQQELRAGTQATHKEAEICLKELSRDLHVCLDCLT
jgi:hypothetical protein